MKITPIEIRQKTFEKALRGLDKDEVQAFLNTLSQQWEKMLEESRTMKTSLDRAEHEVSKMREVESSLYRTLKAADDTSKSITEQAQKEADELRERTRREADELTTRSQREAKELADVSQREARELTERSQREAKELTDRTRQEAEKRLADAKRDAEKQVADARREAERLLTDATAESRKLIEDARREADRLTGGATSRLATLERDQQQLVKFYDQFLNDLRATANGVLAHADKAVANRPRVPEKAPEPSTPKPAAPQSDKPVDRFADQPAEKGAEKSVDVLRPDNPAAAVTNTPAASPAPKPEAEKMELLDAPLSTVFADQIVSRPAKEPVDVADAPQPISLPRATGIGQPEIMPPPGPAVVPSPMAPPVEHPMPEIQPMQPGMPVEKPQPEIRPAEQPQPVQPQPLPPTPTPAPTPAPQSAAPAAEEKSFFDEL